MASECANPLLLKWLGEWLEVARQQNSKGQQTYKKAYESMKACPLPFIHPSEAQQLSGLGPKLCDRLTERMRKHCAENGLRMPDIPKKNCKHPSNDAENASGPAAKRARKSKPYVPFLRSGPYALILALSTLSEEGSQSLTKAQLIQLAQPFCDSSFTAPSDPTKFFTAWNSMKTLLEKDLVFERGRPSRKYALTEEGWEVARRIKKAVAGKEDLLGEMSTGVSKEDEGHWAGVGPTRVWVEPEISSDHRKMNQAPSPRNQQTNMLGSNPVTAVAIPLGPSKATANRELHGAPKNKFSQRNTTARQDAVNNRGESDGDDGFIRISSSSPKQTPKLADGWHSIDSICDPAQVRSPNITSASIQHSNSQGAPKELPQFKPTYLPGGSFAVRLIIDNREIRTKTDRDYMQEELEKKGVPPIVRNLELGDALWVAKCHDSRALEAHGEEGDEVMLDWIVERKRLDDLIGSIKDGRFQEQKFRLRKSGVQNVVYIIEEITMNGDYWSKCQEAVESAIASTQVVDGYFIKKTQKMDDTIHYLARMTMLLKSLYEVCPRASFSAERSLFFKGKKFPDLMPGFPIKSKPLHIIPSSILSQQNHRPLLSRPSGNRNTINHHITYPAFASLASKSDSLTLRDVFLKMLMCTRGLSGEKAVEIQRRWRTPREFAEAFEGLSEENKKEMVMKASEKAVVGRRRIGRKLSEKIAEVWGGL